MPSTDKSQYAPKAWESNEYEFTLPSGDKCLLRKMDPLELGEHGLLDKLDFATSVVMNVHAKNANMSNVERIKRDRARREARARGENPEERINEEDRATMQEIMKNAENSKAFREVMAELLVVAVVAPEMHLPPEDLDDKIDGLFYTDAVPFGDKMAIFNKVMEGVRTAEQFPEGSEKGMGDVAPQPGVRKSAQRSSRSPRKGSVS